MFLTHLLARDSEKTLSSARAYVAALGPLKHQFHCAFEASDDFGGKEASFLDLYPVGPSLAKDHKKFGGVFIRVWAFGQPTTITFGVFLGAERAEQSEPRRGVSVTRKRLGPALAVFEDSEGFSYHTWSSSHFPWTTKSSRAVARQLEQFVSFREDSASAEDLPLIEEKVGKAIQFLDRSLDSLGPVLDFGKAIIHEYYSENLPVATRPEGQTVALGELISTLDLDLRAEGVGIRATRGMLGRLAASLLAKRFVILTGLAGSGKTKVAQAFARWSTAKTSPPDSLNPRFAMVPVGADWTSGESILGYPDGLDRAAYVTKPALDLILHAAADPDEPHFLVLDEMNLSHVERYFAEILSAIESEEPIHLYADAQRSANGQSVPRSITLPRNLFIIGTVNVDETTYMFSPKVLDRANVIEFRLDNVEMGSFLTEPAKPDLSRLDGKGQSAGFGKAFVVAAGNQVALPTSVKELYEAEMLLFFNTLQPHGAEYGYRVAHEASRFLHFYGLVGGHAPEDGSWFPGAFDCVLFQKFLPKLHGSRARLGPLLKKLWFFCVNDHASRGEGPLAAAEAAARSSDGKTEPSINVPKNAPYPLTAEKVARMWRLLNENGFASFAEA